MCRRTTLMIAFGARGILLADLTALIVPRTADAIIIC